MGFTNREVGRSDVKDGTPVEIGKPVGRAGGGVGPDIITVDE
jgi:hypothetical protein